MTPAHRFVVATPGRSVCDDNARVLAKHGLLRFVALGTRRGVAGVPPEQTRLKPAIGLATYCFHRFLPSYRGEACRFALHPWFDRWVKRQLQPGDHILSSYGYVNDCFRWARKNGGKTFLDGGNSHPANFWEILEAEHRRWKCSYPPISPRQHRRALAMVEETDYVLSPSTFVTNSFLARGFPASRILRNVYPLDMSCFSPSPDLRPKDRPLTVISTGGLSLRKGSPYLLESFRILRKEIPNARLSLVSIVQESVKPVLANYRDLPIDWSPRLPHPELAALLRKADVFVLPSLEDGFARTVAEALSCGLPVITTPNTGASDLITPGENGEIVPIRDPQAIAGAVLKWAAVVMQRQIPPPRLLDPARLSFERFEHDFVSQLAALNLAPGF